MALIDRWRALSVWVRDGIGATAFAVVALVPALSPYGVVLGGLPERAADGWYVLLLLGQSLPLAARRIAPATVLGVVAAAFAAHQMLAYPPSPGGLGLFFTLYAVGAHQQRRRRLTAAIALTGYVALVLALVALGSPEQPWEWIAFAVVPSAAWGLGDVVRLRAQASRERAATAARAAVLEERARMARELHDVIGHHVTGIVVQAEAAPFLLPDGDPRIHKEFAAIAASGRAALEDLRQQLDLLDATSTPTSPTIDTLTDVATASRSTGLPVDLTETGTPAGSTELRLAVQRIAQEGLTNAQKHSPGSSVALEVAWGRSEVHVTITNGPSEQDSARPSAPLPGSGRGLAGLTERVTRLGGTLTSGPDDRGGFVLTAALPIARNPQTLHGSRSTNT